MSGKHYQIISLVYRKHICGMLEGCRTLIVLYTLALLGFIFNSKLVFVILSWKNIKCIKGTRNRMTQGNCSSSL